MQPRETPRFTNKGGKEGYSLPSTLPVGKSLHPHCTAEKKKKQVSLTIKHEQPSPVSTNKSSNGNTRFQQVSQIISRKKQLILGQNTNP
jgi:hypothetical protein